MFIKAVPNTHGAKGTYFCYLVESYRIGDKTKHRILQNFGLLNEEQVSKLRATYSKKTYISNKDITTP